MVVKVSSQYTGQNMRAFDRQIRTRTFVCALSLSWLSRTAGGRMRRRKRNAAPINLRMASLSKLEAEQLSVRKRVENNQALLDVDIAKLASMPTIDALHMQVHQCDEAITKATENAKLKRSMLARVLNLGLGAEAAAEVSRLGRRRAEVVERLQSRYDLKRNIERTEGFLNQQQAWLQRLDDEIRQRHTKQDNHLNLRAAAAKNASDVRQMATTIRTRVPRGDLCPYCGDLLGESPHLDHIWPVSKGGRSLPRNLVWVCDRCNRMKGDKTLATFIERSGRDRSAIESRLKSLGKEF